jgi:starch phosphorylase
MEVALQPDLPTYAGGLGILAGDTLRSAADLGLPLAAVTLLHRQGYFEQHLDEHGNQTELPSVWEPEKVLEPVDCRATIEIEARKVAIRAWRYVVQGLGGYGVPVFLLDTALPENSPYDRTLTDRLYGGDERYRLCQEMVLGIGGIEILRAMGLHHVMTYHMNEGHAALLTLALLREHLAGKPLSGASDEDFAFIRRKCVFTTHTPVPAAHDQFGRALVQGVLGDEWRSALEHAGCLSDGMLNMTALALRCSHYVNGVAMQHGEVSRGMYPNYSVRAISNGVHAATWSSAPFQDLYDRHIPEWRRDNLYFRYAIGIPLTEIRQAHVLAKRALIAEVRKSAGAQLSETAMTLGFARRATAYKRADLLFSDCERLRSIARRVGPLQVIYGGKAHPNDEPGKHLIRSVFAAMASLKDIIQGVYVENYDMKWAKLITGGVDLWMNTPQRPYEASGTSGMKAALNGIPSLSVPDGWWREGHVEGATGWDIGREEIPETEADEIASLYSKLENIIVPMFYGRENAYSEVMRSTIALNGSFFNTQRMVSQYVLDAYFNGKQGLSAQQRIEEMRRE